MHAVQYGRNDRRSRRLRSRGGSGVLSRFAASAFVLWALVLLAGCAGEVATHGDLVQDDKLSQIIPLQHGQRDVLGVLGSPSTVSVMDGEAWYYIGDRRESLAFFKPWLLERERVVVAFDQTGTVTSVERITDDEERKIQVVERETPTHGSNLTMIEQFLGNIGRFNSTTTERR